MAHPDSTNSWADAAGKPQQRPQIYIYIDQPNFWVGGRSAVGNRDWDCDVGRLKSLLIRKTTIKQDIEKLKMNDNFDVHFHTYGKIPSELIARWQAQKATVHGLREPDPGDADRRDYCQNYHTKRTDNQAGNSQTEDGNDKNLPYVEKEVDTWLVADSVEVAVKNGHRNAPITELAIVSGDRDMRPAVEKIAHYGHGVHVWSWDNCLSKVFEKMERKGFRVKVHKLDDHKSQFVR